MATTKDKLAFAVEMGRHTQATVRQCEALLRYAGTLAAHHAKAGREGVSLREIAKFNRVVRKVHELCGEIRAGDTFSLRFYLEDIKTNLTGRDYPQERWARSLQYADEALRRDYCEAALGELCVPLFSGATLKIRTPDGGEVEVPA